MFVFSQTQAQSGFTINVVHDINQQVRVFYSGGIKPIFSIQLIRIILFTLRYSFHFISNQKVLAASS